MKAALEEALTQDFTRDYTKLLRKVDAIVLNDEEARILTGERNLVVHPVVDDAGPTWERPGGGPEAQGGRQLRRECCERRIGGLRSDGGPGATTEQIGLRVGPAQASSAVPKACW